MRDPGDSVATDDLDILREHWREAARLLGVEFRAPFVLESATGERFEFACLLPQFGSPRGHLVGLMGGNAMAAVRAGTAAGFAVASMGAPNSGEPNNLASYVDCLLDWGWAVEEKSPPDWYIKASDEAGLHRQALEELVRFERPISVLEKAWQQLPYDFSGNPVVLTISHIKHALQQRIDEEITAKDLELWADLVEGRPGIEYEDEEQCSDLLFRLSTPEINQPLSADTCRQIFASLK
jgi:hypothetical protein